MGAIQTPERLVNGSNLNTKKDEITTRLSKSARIILKNDPDFDKYKSRWSEAAVKTPELIICPSTGEDVSQTLLFCVEHAAEFAVCCGGHSTSGVSSTEGILISLDLMRGVSVNAEKKTVTVQGGARWSDVNAETEKYGLAVVCGTVDHTGVGGLTLGGGYGMATGEYGLVIDNLLSVEIVLADGHIVEASKSQNADLFWAIRGAGVKFGIVTSFVYQVFDQKDDVWGGLLVFSLDKLAFIIDFCQKFLKQHDPKSSMFIAVGGMEGHLMVTAITYYNGLESVAKMIYKQLFDLAPIADTTKPRSYTDMNFILNEFFPTGLRRSLKGSAFLPPLDLEFVEQDIKALKQFLCDTPDAVPSAICYEFVGYHKVLSVPQNETAFANRGAYSNILYCAGWSSPENDNACRTWSRTMAANAHKKFQEALSSAKVDATTRDGVGEYFNYDGVGASGKTIFGSNYPRLCELKARYDPDNVFKKGPDLGRF